MATEMDYITRQLQRIIDDLGDLRDKVASMDARLTRLEASNSAIFEEVRAVGRRMDRTQDRVRRLEDHQLPP